MQITINPKAPKSNQEKALIKRANELKARAESVKADLSAAPNDQITLTDSHERLGSYSYSGVIGKDGFTQANVSADDGKIKSLVAFDAPESSEAAGESIKWFQVRSEATGVRAAIAGAMGAIGGFLGDVAANALAKAWLNAPQGGIKGVYGHTMGAVSKPLNLGSNLFRYAENKISDPGTKDDFFGAYSDTKTEQVTFRHDGLIEFERFDDTKT